MKSGVSGGMHSFIAAETGPGPEGSRLTVDEWRLKGCRAESGFVRMSRYVLPTLNVFHPCFDELFRLISVFCNYSAPYLKEGFWFFSVWMLSPDTDYTDDTRMLASLAACAKREPKARS